MLFRRTNKYGYSRYYGGGGPAWILRIIITLAVIIGLAVGGVMWSMQKYMVYTENGGHLELPWSKDKDAADEEVPNPEDDLIVDLPDGSESGEVSEAEPEASASGEVSEPEPEASVSGEVSEPEPEASVSGEVSEPEPEAGASEEPEQSAEEEPSEPAEAKPGLWERITAWFRNLFASPEKPEVQPENTGDASAPAEEPGDASASAETSAAEPEESAPAAPVERPDPLKGGILVQHVSMGDFTGGFAKGDVQNVKGNGLMLFMKESGGRLNYPTKLDMAQELNALNDSSGISDMKKTLEGLKKDGLYTVAYVDCFQDGKAEDLGSEALLDKSGDPWYDGDDRCWADPASETYQNYLTDIVKELAELGYDEIVLKNACYPASGKTGDISESQYQPEQFAETLNGFYAKLSEAVKGNKTMLSIVTSRKTIRDGADEGIGHTLEGLRQLGGRLWVEAEDDKVESLQQKLEEAAFPENALGVLTGKVSGDKTWCQMNID